MNVWIVIDRYDHSETLTSAHLTEKGAMIKAYNILLEALDLNLKTLLNQI